jgi:predicted DNA-binding transcriptional regulator YafY
MNRIDRLFGILTLLQSRKFLKAQKIAGTFQISQRTVYRDIRSLCEQGIPVSFEQNRGYFLVTGVLSST